MTGGSLYEYCDKFLPGISTDVKAILAQTLSPIISAHGQLFLNIFVVLLKENMSGRMSSPSFQQIIHEKLIALFILHRQFSPHYLSNINPNMQKWKTALPMVIQSTLEVFGTSP